ncbi:MAG: hypothetical protein WC495_04535 [Patescibacteria group bacterium]|jgi:hypothetical protein
MKKDRLQSLVLEQLRKIPIIHVVAEKVGVSRSTIYRWKDESEQFRKDFEVALREGEEFISDMAESQLINLMKDKHWPSIRFWLERRSEKFRNRLEVSGSLQMPQEELSPEQQAIVREALRLAHLTINKETNTYDQQHSE